MPAIRIQNQLPFVTVELHANGQKLILDHVLLDTGSAATIFKTEDLARLGVELQPDDPIRSMIGVGGREIVIEKHIEAVALGDLVARPFVIQMGALDYGMPLDGILGLDFLKHVNAIINFRTWTINA